MILRIKPHIRKLCTVSFAELPHVFTTKNQSETLIQPPCMIEVNLHVKQLVKSGHLKDARKLFDEMPRRDEISWTTMISGYVDSCDYSEALNLFSCMWVDSSLKLDPFIVSLALKACGLGNNLSYGELIHCSSVKTGLVSSVFVGSSLLDMYAKNGRVFEGCRVFGEMPEKNVVSWTAIINGLVKGGYSKEGLRYFFEMWRCKVQCDTYTFAIALKACADENDLRRGREIHTQAIKRGFDVASFVANTLATMYNKGGKLDYGMVLFSRMRTPDVVSWTTIITTYVQMGNEESAIREFLRMRESDVRPNEYTFASIISGCANLGKIQLGEALHAQVTRLGLLDDLSVANSIMVMYSKCGKLESASVIFNTMTRRDIFSWSTIIAGYSQAGHGEETFELLSWMRREGPKPTEFALASALSVCGSMAILEQGRQLHAHVLTVGFEHTPMIQCALINMYTKCGSIKEAEEVFNSSKNNDIITWTAMINGYAEHGISKEAIDLFEKIPVIGLKPDSVTFIGVLSACSHAGLVDLGFYFFNSMNQKYQINPTKEHYGCMVDLLCRAGRLSEAENMINSMPYKGDDVVWSTLLRASRVLGDIERGRRASEKLLELNPNCAGTHITLANIYSVKGKWKEAAEIRKLMKSKGVMKEPGSSWLKVKDRVSTFVSGDKSHPEGEDMYHVLDLIGSEADVSFQDMDTLLYGD